MPPVAEGTALRASLIEEVRLLQEAHCDDELALTQLAYGQHLLASHRRTEAREALSQARSLMQSAIARHPEHREFLRALFQVQWSNPRFIQLLRNL